VYPYSLASGFGTGSQHLYISATGGWFPTPAPGVTVLTNGYGSTSAVKVSYGNGRVILTAPNPTLRGDSDLDWTRWDNWVLNGTHPNSLGAWQLFGRMINWADTGSAEEPVISAENPAGKHVAVVSSYIYTTSGYGGAWPGLLPAVGRVVEDSGHIPLSIRFKDIIDDRLTLSDFDAVVFPGGSAAGYYTGLAGSEDKIRDYVRGGGCYLGICAGSFYASSSIIGEGTEYDYPLDLFSGQDIGPIHDLSEDPSGSDWTYYTLTPISINDDVLGNIGIQQQFYFGGGYKTAAVGVTPVALYADPTSSSNEATDAIRFSYGEGRVFLTGAHPEVRSGSDVDWLFWDNYYHKSSTELHNPDNPWLFVNAVFNKWFFPVPVTKNVTLTWLQLLLGQP
jgi:biotin--protein ligase